MVGENILEVFLAVPTMVGENILGVFLADQGTDAAPRAHGPGALGSQPVSADGNKKNQIASRFDFVFVLTWYGVIYRRDSVI